MIGMMIDELGTSILENVVQVATLLSTLLKSEDEDTLTISLGILAALLDGWTLL